MTTTDNRFLAGPFAPVPDELTAVDLLVTGVIPEGLAGRYLRNGPNPRPGFDDPNYHWFIGSGMVHGVRLRDGRAEWYRNRWVRSKAVAEQLGETWVGGPVNANMDAAPNTHVVSVGGRTLATVESGPLPYELSYELDTIGPCDFEGTLPGGFAAHTKHDAQTDELHAVAYYWGWDHVQHVVVDARGSVSRTTDVAVPDGPMMHDFGLTETYVVLMDLPVTFSMDAVSSGSELPYTWNDNHPPRIGLLRRDGRGPVQWIDVDPCFVFHTLNAYDDGDGVVLDVCRYDRAYDVSTLRGPGPVTLDRWTIDPAGGKVTTERLDDQHQEFPRIDERRVGQRHRYGYSAVIGDAIDAILAVDHEAVSNEYHNAILKHDVLTGRREAHEFGPGATVGEMVFVPAAVNSAEDDGFLMGFVHDPDRDAADLVILSAQDFTGEPVARIHLPTRIPLGFHGNWMPD